MIGQYFHGELNAIDENSHRDKFKHLMIMNNKCLYQQVVVKSAFENYRQLNSQLSLRSFAKSLDVDSSILSRVLNLKREFSVQTALKIADKLKLSTEEKNKFLGLAQTQYEIINLDENEYETFIVEWEYFAFIDLLYTHNFKYNFPWMAKRLQISTDRAMEVFHNLREKNIIEINSLGKIVKRNVHLKTSSNKTSLILQRAHQVSCDLAKSKLSHCEVTQKDYSTLTMAINSQRIPLAKKLIEDFKKDLIQVLCDGRLDEVYQLNLFLFPLTDLSSADNRENRDTLI